jgi:hypothetical protein
MRSSWFPLVFLLAGCATSTAPRFDQDLATTFAQDDMRRLESPELELYYPAEHKEAALRVAARAAECLRELRARAISPAEPGKALLFLSSANYNNAYVGGQSLGEPLHSVNALSTTSEIFHWYGLGGAEQGDVSCHEMFHYAHYEQAFGFWGVVNTILGPVLPPQAFLERWFTEGVAQYYEGRLHRTVGRPYSPIYRASFDSFVAMRGGRVEPGDLSLSQRELNPFGGAYLTGYFFIEWLATKYGEEKLWQVMRHQGRDFFSPFGATLRMKSVYGLSTGALIEEWSKDLTAQLEQRARPPSEKVLFEDVGQLGRIAAHPASGTIALISSGNEQVPLLRIFEADGRLRLEQRLARLGTDRDWVYVGPGSMSGLSFTGDGKFLWLLNDDLIARGDTRAQLWKIDAQTGEVLQVIQEIGRGLGGSVSADGRSFTFVDLPPGQSRLVEKNLETGALTVLAEFPPEISVSAPHWNDAHTRLVYTRHDPNGWNLVLREADGTTRDLTTDGAFNYAPKWIDDGHVLFARTAGKYLQAHRLDVGTGVVERLTDAPYGVLDPVPTAGGVVALARDGVHWSLDTMPGEALETIALEPVEIPKRHESPPLVVQKDEPYTSLDHLFLPQLRLPGGGLFSTSAGLGGNISLSLMGRDRLGRHTWAINGSLELPSMTNYVQAGYRNLAFAPWAFIVSGERNSTAAQTYWTGGLYAQRSVWTVPVTFGVQAEVWQPFGQPLEKYIGPTFSLGYSAGDATQYAGPQRTLNMSLDVSAYPRFLGSDRDLLDVRGAVSLAFPLPLSKRHSFVIGATGRTLPGAPEGALLLGGIPGFTTIVSSPVRTPFPAGPPGLLPGTLIEGIRGYDDFAIRTRHAAIFNARYRYSFIIDRGTASVLWLLPSFFFRQIDLEAFGSAAITETQSAKAVGAAIFFRTQFAGLLPVSLVYQFAWRFDFGLPPLHVVAVSFD